MGKIKIGADELILWLRKNEKAMDIHNDVLGEKIRKLIEEDKEKKIYGIKMKQEPCLWAREDGDENIGPYNLPKTATQYWIDTDKLPQLYEELNQW